MTPDDLISDGYREQLRGLSWGGGAATRADEIRLLAKSMRAMTVLDYGCGPGTLKQRLAEISPALAVTEYDPAALCKSELPQPADIVVCIDVLEHVEPDKIAAVISHIYGLTRMAAFVLVATRPAEKRLPDGRNAHLIIDNAAWWREQFAKHDWKVDVLSASVFAGDAKFLLRRRLSA